MEVPMDSPHKYQKYQKIPKIPEKKQKIQNFTNVQKKQKKCKKHKTYKKMNFKFGRRNRSCFHLILISWEELFYFYVSVSEK